MSECEVELKITGPLGSGKSVLISLISVKLLDLKIPFTILEDEHKMKVNLTEFLTARKYKP